MTLKDYWTKENLALLDKYVLKAKVTGSIDNMDFSTFTDMFSNNDYQVKCCTDPFLPPICSSSQGAFFTNCIVCSFNGPTSYCEDYKLCKSIQTRFSDVYFGITSSSSRKHMHMLYIREVT